MDPLTQGVVGAVAAQPLSSPSNRVAATLLGLLSGMAPDLDVLISSVADPLLSLEYHRQFTHSLLFIPIGGLLCASVFYILLAKRFHLSFWQVYVFCTLGYASHGLLDACTTYGTQLLWPLTDERFAWHTISIIDPLLTLPLLGFVIMAMIQKKRIWFVLSFVWLLVYSALGVMQRERAEAMGWQLAKQRGDSPLRVEAKPSFANLLLWKVATTTETAYQVDAVRVGWQSTVYEGDRLLKLNIRRDLPWLDLHSQQAKDIERFRWFSNGYIALSPDNPYRIIDVRYSFLPHQISALWGIELNPSADKAAHVDYVVNRQRSRDALGQLWRMLVADD